MARYSVNTKMDAEKVMDKAVRFFATDLNMGITEQRDCCVRFTGGGGFVHVYAIANHGVKEITIETQEWNDQVEKFLVDL